MSVTVVVSAFEGLFVKSLQPTGAFREGLRARGFDLDHLQSVYPLEVWTNCVDLAAAEHYPQLPLSQAWEQLGRKFIEGYLLTLPGKVVAMMLPFLRPRSFINQVPRFMTMGKRGSEASVKWLDERHAIITMLGTHQRVGALMAGVVAVAFERMKVAPVQIEARELGGVDAEKQLYLLMQLLKPN